jgi:hypothetical protein
MVLVTGGALACTLGLLYPRSTSAEEISDEERAGEWSEDGMKFGEIAVKADIVADAKVPGGWAIVRTIVNTSDAPQTASVEERIMRAESMVDARVDGTAVVASAVMRTFTLRPHERRKIGFAMPVALGEAVTAGRRTEAAARRAQDRMFENGQSDPATSAVYERTFSTFFVEYLKPLPPGATAQLRGSSGPGRLPSTLPPAEQERAAEDARLARLGPSRGPK